MRIQQLGHVVLKVRNRDRSEQFYRGVLGLPVVARRDKPPMTFFSLGNHHDFAIVAVGDDGPDAPSNGPGLYHVAFRVGDSIEDLREARASLESNGVKVQMIADHTVTKSLYFTDPDGNGLEMYVDASDVWQQDPQRVADYAPLTL